jgi:signal recognition particle GTPase
VLLVLDGSTGQNALEQAKQFTAVTDVTALAITKLDGTAKGGIVLAIASQFKIPVSSFISTRTASTSAYLCNPLPPCVALG